MGMVAIIVVGKDLHNSRVQSLSLMPAARKRLGAILKQLEMELQTSDTLSTQLVPTQCLRFRGDVTLPLFFTFVLNKAAPLEADTQRFRDWVVRGQC